MRLFSVFRPHWRAPSVAAMLLLLSGCSYSHGNDAPVPCENATPALAKFDAVVMPIFEANCKRCHAAAVANRLGAGYQFDNYSDISKFNTNQLLGAIRHEPNYVPMPVDGGKISDCDIRRIEAWVAAGKPSN